MTPQSSPERAAGETPRTDREVFNAYDEEGDALPAVDPAFARQLEREAGKWKFIADEKRKEVIAICQSSQSIAERADKAERESADLRQALAEAAAKADAEMERVKACEHIAEDDDWEVLRNLCPSTAAVARLRDRAETAEAELAEARRDGERKTIERCNAAFRGLLDRAKVPGRDYTYVIKPREIASAMQTEGKPREGR